MLVFAMQFSRSGVLESREVAVGDPTPRPGMPNDRRSLKTEQKPMAELMSSTHASASTG